MSTQNTDSVTVKSQKKTFRKDYTEGGKPGVIIATVRWDDQCGNGKNSFSVTATIYEDGKDVAGGCCHEEVVKHLPELAHLIRWHLFDPFGPMHYVSNTVYHAGDRDHRGLKIGEKKQLKAGGKTPVWVRVVRNPQGEEVPDLFKWTDSEEKPAEEKLTIQWEPKWIVGEGKKRELDAARNTAAWPEATDAELTSENLKERLLERLPGLLEAFRKDIEALGFVY
jgi:hypothetical protein